MFREDLETSPLDIVAEFESVADARAAGIAADAMIVRPPSPSWAEGRAATGSCLRAGGVSPTEVPQAVSW